MKETPNFIKNSIKWKRERKTDNREEPIRLSYQTRRPVMTITGDRICQIYRIDSK